MWHGGRACPDFRENPEQRRRAEFGRSWRIELTVRVCPSRPWLKFLRVRVAGRSVKYVRGRFFVALGLILLSAFSYTFSRKPHLSFSRARNAHPMSFSVIAFVASSPSSMFIASKRGKIDWPRTGRTDTDGRPQSPAQLEPTRISATPWHDEGLTGLSAKSDALLYLCILFAFHVCTRLRHVPRSNHPRENVPRSR
jgi:hypothetical protein